MRKSKKTLLLFLFWGCSVQKQSLLQAEKSVQQTVYLTTDDGPAAGTEQVLNVAEQEQVPVAFFLIGSQLANDPKNTNRLRLLKGSTLATLANHSYSHALYYNRFYSEPEYILDDFFKNEKILGLSNVKKYSRIPARNLYSFPGNLINKTELFQSEFAVESKVYEILIKNGFSLIGWDYYWSRNIRTGQPEPEDGRLAAADALRLLQQNKTTKPGKLVVILHDDMFSDRFGGAERLRDFIQTLKSRGLKFMPLEVY